MKILILISLIILASCGKETKRKAFDIEFFGEAVAFKQVEANAFHGMGAVENSLVKYEGDIFAIFDPTANGTIYKSSLGQKGMSFKDGKKVDQETRFSYVMEHDGTYYNFYAMKDGIHLKKSSDLENWEQVNHGKAVLKTQSGTIYDVIWNVGVAVDDDGTWHMLIECADNKGSSADQGGVGLAYSNATMSGEEIDFDTNKTMSHVIPRGGNPHLVFIRGKGLLAIHGQLNDRTFELGSEWYVTASKLNSGDSEWTTFQDAFAFGKKGVHICDPSLIETEDGLLMTVSVNQDSIYKLLADGITFADLFDRLN